MMFRRKWHCIVPYFIVVPPALHQHQISVCVYSGLERGQCCSRGARLETMKLSVAARVRSPDSDIALRGPRPHRRRKIRNPALVGASKTFSKSGPRTPLLFWKLDDAERSVSGADSPPASAALRDRRSRANAVSARRLAASIWKMQTQEIGGDGGERCRQLPREGETSTAALERATKWDPRCSNASEEVYKFNNHLKSLEDQHLTAVSGVSVLQTELEQAHVRISDLETERRATKKKLDQYLRKVFEEMALCRRKEHDKVWAIIDDMKADLNREKKNRQRIEFVNSKLVNELAEAKLSVKKLFQDYEKERRAREFMEEVCDQLAKELEEEKAEVQALKAESLKIREEVEEERKMLQMAEVWREERVQMKLVDAKLTLEEKYSQLRNLETYLEEFLRDTKDHKVDALKIKEAESLLEAVCSVKALDMDFSYEPPPASDDILSVFEELQLQNGGGESGIAVSYACRPGSRDSKIHTVSPDTDCFLEKPTRRYTNGSLHHNGDAKDSGWETISVIEDQESSNSPVGSDLSVNGFCEGSNVSFSGTDWEDRGLRGRRSNGDLSALCSATTRLSRRQASSIRFWRSSGLNNGVSSEARMSNSRKSNATSFTPQECRSDSVVLSPQSLGQWNCPDSVSPHVSRGMKGCIEWPRGGMQKHSLKTKLLEAGTENQKVQLKHVLKKKI